jgi:hypothetical protein
MEILWIIEAWIYKTRAFFRIADLKFKGIKIIKTKKMKDLYSLLIKTK